MIFMCLVSCDFIEGIFGTGGDEKSTSKKESAKEEQPAGEPVQVLKSIEDLTLNARRKCSFITKEALKNKIDSPDIIIIDVREPYEYFAGKVPNSINIPRGVIEFQIYLRFPEIEKDDEIILIDRQGKRRAPLSAEQLMRIGFTNIFVLEGGCEGSLKKKSRSPDDKDTVKTETSAQ